MGWWAEQSGKNQLIIGDEPLDAAGAMLSGVVAAYQRDVGRKPTLAELARTLEIVLTAKGEGVFQDIEGKDVTGVVIKAVRCPARQTPAVGDYFAVPLSEGGFGFGRVEDIVMKSLLLVAFLDAYSKDVPDFADVSGAPVLFELVCGNQGLMNREWTTFGNVQPSHPYGKGTEEERCMEYQLRLGGAHSYVRARELLEERLKPRRRQRRRFPR